MLNRLARGKHLILLLHGDERETRRGAGSHDVDARLEVDDERRDFREPIEGAAAAAGSVTPNQIFHFRYDVHQRGLDVQTTDLPRFLMDE